MRNWLEVFYLSDIIQEDDNLSAIVDQCRFNLYIHPRGLFPFKDVAVWILLNKVFVFEEAPQARHLTWNHNIWCTTSV